MGEMKEVPSGWVIIPLGKVCENVVSIRRKEVQDDDEILYLDIGCIDNIKNEITGHKQYKWKNAPSRAQQIIYKNDILFSTVRTYLKNIAMVKSDIYNQQIASSGFTVIRGNKRIVNPSYLFYFSISNSFLGLLDDLQTGTSYPAVRDSDVFSQFVPLPPLPEQHRIVAKIEELFSSLDKGIESLKTAQAQLKIYRQAVLKWAFEGKLTNADVKEGELPEGWRWTRSSEVFEYITSGSRGWAKFYSDNGAIFIRMGNLDHDTILLDLSDIQYVKLPDKAEGTRSLVHSGDILISITADVGMIGLVPDKFPEAYINQHVALARPKSGIIHPTYLAWYLASKENGQKQLRELQRGATKVGLGLDDIRAVNIPICPIKEQSRIVAEIESRLSVCDKLEESITRSLLQSEALRQSILKKAFEGKLVPQDPNDEPASVLLDRIRAERESVVAKNATTRAGGVQGRKRK